MEPRMDHPAYVVPGAMDALQALGAAVGGTGLDPVLVELVCLRASQINGCSVCVDGHWRVARRDRRDRRAPVRGVGVAGGAVLHRRRARRVWRSPKR